MATVREYAYYWEGNKIAIVERDTAFDNDVNSKDFGPGSDRSQWKSPKSTISDGLEIQYTYAPTYRVNNTSDESYKLYCNGWFVDTEGYLNIARTAKDFDAALVSAVGISNDTHIYVGGSSRWSGIHKIKAVGTQSYEGNIQLYTKVSFPEPYISGSVTFASSGNTATLSASTMNDTFSAGDYVFIYGRASLTASNGGLFSVDSVTQTVMTLGTYYAIEDAAANTTIDDWVSTADASCADETVSVYLYKGHYDPLYIVSADVMTDESFEIELEPYLNKAIVIYLKARSFEDMGDLERKEYYMKQFYKQIEKYNNSKITGIRIIAPGPLSIR